MVAEGPSHIDAFVIKIDLTSSGSIHDWQCKGWPKIWIMYMPITLEYFFILYHQTFHNLHVDINISVAQIPQFMLKQ